ncbi:MAG: SRPBCC domain-containing protein [Bellilinea sp.]
MYASFTFTVDLPVYPERVYRAWLDSYEHTLFTGSPAQIDGQLGQPFLTLNGQVKGIIKNLSPFDRIVQTWNTAGFPANDPGAEIELTLEPTCTGTQMTLIHRGIAAGSTRQVMQWWEEVYFRPLRKYFDDLVGDYVADMGDG